MTTHQPTEPDLGAEHGGRLLQLGRSAVYDLLRSSQLASTTLGRSARCIPTHALTDFIRTRLKQEAA
ncbi:DNA-binding protein [Streptomyces sp. NPDC058220]|uniref:DNA-binding protein n=1 Tax=unclassified Streptomyces TaxID=2593676 RepID=UPI0036EA1508